MRFPTINSIARTNIDGRTEFKFDLGADGSMTLYFYDGDRNESVGHHRDFMCGTWVAADGKSWMASNNQDNYGHGPGIEQAFTPNQAGAAFEYFWQQRVDSWEAIRKQEYEERKERRERIARRQIGLKGGLGGHKPGQPLFSFG